MKGDKIGKGAFGLVFKGLNQANGQIIAIKELSYDPKKDKQIRELVKEVCRAKISPFPPILFISLSLSLIFSLSSSISFLGGLR